MEVGALVGAQQVQVLAPQALVEVVEAKMAQQVQVVVVKALQV